MKKVNNKISVEGYLYDHTLENKVTGERSKNPGSPYIGGTISIAVDDDMTNVIKVSFSYVPPAYNGQPNRTYNIFQSILDGKIGNVMEHGKENAGKLSISGKVTINDWMGKDGEIISMRRNEGRFVSQVTNLKPEKDRAVFHVDMVINDIRRCEPDEEKNLPDRVYLKGAIFDPYTNELYPMEFVSYEPYVPARALDFMENLGASPSTPIFTQVKGQLVSRTVIKKKEEESGWGEINIVETKSTERNYVATWIPPTAYEWDTEETITGAELSEKMSNREIHLAEIKASAPSANTAPKGKYNF